MIDWITNFVVTFDFTSLMGVVLYWAPMSLCAFGYTLRTHRHYRKDLKNRQQYYEELAVKSDTGLTYRPTDTIGDILGRALVAIVPIANIWAALFNVAPEVFGNFFKFIGKVFDQPLVPNRKKK